MNFFKILNQGWVGVTIGILGIIFSYITYRTSKIGPRLVYQFKSLEIIGGLKSFPNELEIVYKGKSVPRVTKTNIIIWNSGTKTIEGSNIITEDPLKFVFNNDAKILRIIVVKKKRNIINLDITQNDKEPNIAYFSFNFLDPKDGVVIEILHTDIDHYPKIKGTIMGIPKGFKKYGTNKLYISNKLKVFIIILTILGIISSTLVLYYDILLGRPYIIPTIQLILLLSLGIPFWQTRRKYPKELEDFITKF